jgi:hypothetical protein
MFHQMIRRRAEWKAAIAADARRLAGVIFAGSKGAPPSDQRLPGNHLCPASPITAHDVVS